MEAEERLQALGYHLPAAPSPVGAYVPARRASSFLYISGQISRSPEKFYRGKIGTELSLEEGEEAARLCALNILAVAKAELGSLDRIRGVVRIAGYIQSSPGFMDHPRVLNAASELLVQVLGEGGRHARVALGVESLPLGAAVEVEALFQLEEESSP